jgi:uncharacterized protein YneF (UPF0154 family)
MNIDLVSAVIGLAIGLFGGILIGMFLGIYTHAKISKNNNLNIKFILQQIRTMLKVEK